MGTPFIVITSGCTSVSHDEIRFVIGHELVTHSSGDVVFRTMLMDLDAVGLRRSGRSHSAVGRFAPSSPR